MDLIVVVVVVVVAEAKPQRTFSLFSTRVAQVFSPAAAAAAESKCSGPDDTPSRSVLGLLAVWSDEWRISGF